MTRRAKSYEIRKSPIHGNGVFAARDIKKGEEILYNYGYAFEHFLDHPCRCGFPECVGYIVAVEDRPKLRKKLLNMRRKKP